METMLHIPVDSAVLTNAEKYAKSINKSLSEIVSDFLISIHHVNPKNTINTYDDLVSALEESKQAIKEGRVVPEDIVRKKIRRYAGLDDV